MNDRRLHRLRELHQLSVRAGAAPALEVAFAGGGVRLTSTPTDYSEN
jgi:hypothetical protein